jgi:hypothetical protein
MKPVILLTTLLLFSMGMPSMADTDFLLVDDFENADQLPHNHWKLVEDGVMGGVSTGIVELSQYQGKPCLRLSGSISTKNNGGFIQVRREIDPTLAKTASEYAGIELLVAGNNEAYNLHLKQKGLFFPWQSFRATFTAKQEWQSIRLPFDKFEAYRTSSSLQPSKMTQLALVAIGRDFEADVCIASIGLYR